MKILAIDPGSTSTKIGIYIDGKLEKETVTHDRKLIDGFSNIPQQKDFRLHAVFDVLNRYGLKNVSFDGVVARGGLLKPIEGGIYAVNSRMIEDLMSGRYGQHAANLGGIIAYELAGLYGCPAFIVDPPTIDEMLPVAKLSGFKEITRSSKFHALNQRAVAKKAAKDMGMDYLAMNVIVAHMGGGISIGAHKKGRVVDVNNALDGDGPYAIERTGSLPVGDLVRVVDQKKFTPKELLEIFSKKGGVYSYLGTTDMIEIEKRIKDGDEYTKLIVDGLIYQVVKEIGALCASLAGKVDGIVLTGGLAKSKYIVKEIKEKVSFLALVLVYPGEFEIETLIDSAIGALNGKEKVKTYV